jgi:peroxiredoxin Q/BCP
LARLREAYPAFSDRGAEILAVGPDSARTFALYWRAESLPFVGMPDPEHRVALRYRQEVNIFKLGRMPLITAIDPMGLIRFAHYAVSMSDIPDNETLLEALDRIMAAAI